MKRHGKHPLLNVSLYTVYTKIIGEPNDFQEDLGQNNTENEQASLKENDWDFETKFHFAMASQWHVNGGTHRIVIDQEALLYSWLAGCVQYIKEQLLYVSGGR